MKINKVSDEHMAPTWAFDSKSLDKYENDKSVNRKEIERLNITESSKITEDVIAKECAAIEKCASEGKTYHYNSAWPKEKIDHLKEFASVCGIDKGKVKGIDPSVLFDDIKDMDRKAEATKIIRTASKTIDTSKIKFDPFHIEERTSETHMDKEEWQEIKRQSDLEDSPTWVNGALKPIRGGEDYFKNAESKLAKNQNSITDPDAIQKLSESEVVDNGARLKAEKEAKIAAHKDAHAEWEKNFVDSMEQKDIVPKGKVFPTESMNAQSGLGSPSSKMGVYAKFTPDSIPEKTDGEMLKETRQEWNKSIQRPEKAKAEFDLSHHSIREVSDTFAEELKKLLK